MAKGNMLNGTVKGRIGGAVYYVKKGEQNIVNYNKHVANPQTGRQMFQRARFSNAGRFYTRGRKAYFKFAFEGKKASQSDFNAFMKANINRSVLISRSALQLEGYPAIGKFIMSQGSLKPVRTRIVNDYWQASFYIPMPTGGVSTIGELSRLLIATGDYEQGDILTFVYIWTTSNAYIPSAQPIGTANTTWLIKQFIVNTADTTPLSNHEMRAVTRKWENVDYLTLTDLEDSQIIGTTYGGFTCVHSRNTRSGLKVSTQELFLGEGMNEAYELAQSTEYIDAVIADWKSTGAITYAPDAILKGSLSYSAAPVSGITLAEVGDGEWQLSGTTFFAENPKWPYNDHRPANIFGNNIDASQFVAKNLEGNGAQGISFVQAATNKVEVVLNSTELETGNYVVQICMLIEGQPIPICNIRWEQEVRPVTNFITTDPQLYKGATFDFTTNEELPQQTIYIRQEASAEALTIYHTLLGRNFYDYKCNWEPANNRWYFADEGIGECSIVPLGNNTYRLTHSYGGQTIIPFAVVSGSNVYWQDNIVKLINNDYIILTIAEKQGIGDWVVDTDFVSIEGQGAQLPRKKVASIKILHNGTSVSTDNFTYEDVSNDRGIELVYNSTNDNYDVYAWYNNSNYGESYVYYNDELIYQFNAIE